MRLRFGFILLLVFCFSLAGKAQVSDGKIITISANFNSTLSLSMEESYVSFTFETEKEYLDGIGGNGKSFYSKGSVSATANWKLSCKALKDFLHEDGVTSIPLNNIGVRAKYFGETRVDNYAERIPKALSKSEMDLIGYDGLHSNANDREENVFVLIWEMGTRKGNMNNSNLLEQDVKKGSYSTQIEVVVTEVLK